MSDELKQILTFVVLFAGIPATIAILLHVFLRKPFQRLVDKVFGGAGSSWSVSRTVRLSTGPASSNTLRWSSTLAAPDASDLDAERARAAPLRPESVRRYREAWRLIQSRFHQDPAQSVRAAHHLVLEVARERGEPAVLDTQQQLVHTDLATTMESMRGAYRQIRDMREAAHASERALAHDEVSDEALRKTMQQYERVIEHLLGQDARPQ